MVPPEGGTVSVLIKPTRIYLEKTQPQPSNDPMLRGQNLTTTKLVTRLAIRTYNKQRKI
jgi:hypothetical protein